MDAETNSIELHLTAETTRCLRAFAVARNGSIHNQADAALRVGIERLVSEAPESFRERYRRLLTPKQEEPRDG